MLSPALARWVTNEFEGVDAFSFHFLGYANPDNAAEDGDVAESARETGAVVLTKDSDFADEVRRKGAPPVVLVRTPNATTAVMREVLRSDLPLALTAVQDGHVLVEIGV
jgi:predicted nuclease of predicted toxin-antitoxin system